MTSPDLVTTPSQAAKHFGCTTQTIYDNMERGRLTGFKSGHAWIVVKDEKFAAFKVHDTGIRLRDKE
jgi:hypothetical protein